MDTKPGDSVLWSDESLVVINKPPGLLTLPDGYDPTLPHISQLLEAKFGRLWIVHRLDKDTSGLLVLARTAEAHRILNTAFETRQVTKVYHALVAGSPEWDERRVCLPLRVNGDRQHRTIVDARKGKPAITNLRVLERFSQWALIEASPETGRTHQIRAHLAVAGFPILGDALYGGDEEQLIKRAALHACSLAFPHPVTGEGISFQAPYPEDFLRVLEFLRKQI